MTSRRFIIKTKAEAWNISNISNKCFINSFDKIVSYKIQMANKINPFLWYCHLCIDLLYWPTASDEFHPKYFAQFYCTMRNYGHHCLFSFTSVKEWEEFSVYTTAITTCCYWKVKTVLNSTVWQSSGNGVLVKLVMDCTILNKITMYCDEL